MLYLAIFNPISDCGCFGEAIHLTNWQTFFKNLILLPCITLLFVQRRKIPPIAPRGMEWSFVVFFLLIAGSVWFHSYRYVPMYEFTPYKTGSFISTDENDINFETSFIYEKDGSRESFTIDNLPDSSWSYVETVTEISGNAGTYSDFMIMDADGEDISGNILLSSGAVLSSIYSPARLNSRDWDKIASFGEKVIAAGAEFYVAASVTGDAIPSGFPFDVYYADRKLLLTINRSNGGATLFSDSYIGQKWTLAALDRANLDDVLAQDGETLMLNNAIRSNLRTSGLVVGLIIIIVLIYYICKVSYKNSTLNAGKKKKNENN